MIRCCCCCGSFSHLTVLRRLCNKYILASRERYRPLNAVVYYYNDIAPPPPPNPLTTAHTNDHDESRRSCINIKDTRNSESHLLWRHGASRAEQSGAEQLSCLSTDGQLHHHRHRWCVCVSAVHVIISGTAVPFGCSSGGPRWGPWDGPSLDLARPKVISI